MSDREDEGTSRPFDEAIGVLGALGSLFKTAAGKLAVEVRAGLASGLRQMREDIEAQQAAMAEEDGTMADDVGPDVGSDERADEEAVDESDGQQPEDDGAGP